MGNDDAVLSRTPWAPKPKSKERRYKLTKARRRALIDAVAQLLRSGEPTVFRFMASTRYGLRVGFIIKHGWPWVVADVIAAGIVSAALDQIGAKFPRWIEGQNDFAQMGVMLVDHCWNCGKPLLSQLGGKYCSADCRQQFHGHVVRPWLRYGDAYRSAVRMTRGLDEQHNA